jgi:hypothetical protein
MTHIQTNPSCAGSVRMRTAVLLAALLVSGFLVVSPAAAFEQVGTFAGSPSLVKEEKYSEEVQLGGVNGMAVNYTGAGGVPAGTIYAVAEFSAQYSSEKGVVRVARYNPDLSFSETWDFLTKKAEEAREAKGEPPYIRCGPEGDSTYPSCPPRPGERANLSIGIDVDQTTGNVYVFTDWNEQPGTPTIAVYSADGSEVITRFAETAPNSGLIAQSPEKVHEAEADDIAVDAAGTVYVFDRTDSEESYYHRLMVWKPQSPGDYEHYVYAGQGGDIGAGPLGTTRYPMRPTVDASGYVYTTNEERIEKYDPTHPADPPICSFQFKKGGITSMTVNPASGEVFFYAANNDRKLHRLSACKEGKFSEVEALVPAPDLQLYGLTYDPVRAFGPGRPAGILYGGAGGLEADDLEAGEVGRSSLGYIFAPGREAPPQVVSMAVSAVTSSSARLEGKVNPLGTPSTYAFQYISDAAYQANEPGERFAGGGEVPLGGGLIEGAVPIPVGDAVGGLLPDTEYHYRLRAVSHCKPNQPAEECVVIGAEKTLRTYPAGGLGLPDGRAYELVSPVEKHGGQVFPAEPLTSSCVGLECKPGFAFNHFPMQSAPDGSSVVYEGDAFSFDEGAVIENSYISRRDSSGWQTVNLTPARLQSKGSGGNGGFLAFDADLSEALLGQTRFPLVPEAPAGYGNLYLQPSVNPLALNPLLAEAPPNRSPGFGFNSLRLSYGGASADLSRIFFTANDALTEEAPFAPAAVDGGEGKDNLYEWSGGQLALVNVAPDNATSTPGAVFGSGTLLSSPGVGAPDNVIGHAISDDGRRVFWSSASGQVYVREDGETTRELTDHAGRFLTASADGSKVLLSDGCLYDVDAEACEDLTQGNGGFLGVAGYSDDFSHVYFVDSAVLTGEEENEHGDKAEAGKPNLYAHEEGDLAFVATLDQSSGGQSDASDWDKAEARRTAEASPDGRWLAFVSRARLTGFDSSCANGTFLCRSEVFLYDSATGDLRCPSCTPSGASPLGSSGLPRFLTGGNTLSQPRYLSNSGRLFFDSQDSLNPADTNGRVEDVYELEPGGVGGCNRAAGCVSLISAGRFGVDSNFLAADPSGKNVFFTTRDRLVPADKDELIDLYDAREGGGFPPEADSAECQGEACLPAASPPVYPTPASLSLRGSGNVKPAAGHGRHCPKGKVKHGKCVKKHRGKHHRRHRRRHHNHGGEK